MLLVGYSLYGIIACRCSVFCSCGAGAACVQSVIKKAIASNNDSFFIGFNGSPATTRALIMQEAWNCIATSKNGGPEKACEQM